MCLCGWFGQRNWNERNWLLITELAKRLIKFRNLNMVLLLLLLSLSSLSLSLSSSSWRRTMGLRSSRKPHISIKSQSREIWNWICCCCRCCPPCCHCTPPCLPPPCCCRHHHCYHPHDGGLWAWGPRENSRSLSSHKAEKFEYVVVIVVVDVVVVAVVILLFVVLLLVIVIILVMEDYGLEVLAKTSCLYQVPKLRNLNMLLLLLSLLSSLSSSFSLLLLSLSLLSSSAWWSTMGLRSTQKPQVSIKSQSWEIWIWICWCCHRCHCCPPCRCLPPLCRFCHHCHHPHDGGLWAWGRRVNSRSLSSPKAEKFEYVVVIAVVVAVVILLVVLLLVVLFLVIVIVIIIVIILVMKDYGLEVLAKTSCLYQVPKLRNLNLNMLLLSSLSPLLLSSSSSLLSSSSSLSSSSWWSTMGLRSMQKPQVSIKSQSLKTEI